MTSSPLVSVIMPTYNRVELSLQTVESILRQTYKNLELIAISDGCTDKTIEQFKKIQDSRLIIVEAEHVGQPSNHRNLGIQLAKGEYIAFADDDDLWAPVKLTEQIDFLEKNRDIDFIGSYSYIINDNRVTNLPKLNRFLKKLYNFLGKYSRNLLFITNVFLNSTVIVRKKVINQFQLNTSKEYKAIEDYDLWLRMSKKHKSVVLPEPLIFYRIHSSSISCPITNHKKAIYVLKHLREKNKAIKIGVLRYHLTYCLKKWLNPQLKT